jgi:hypothetical protein
MLRIYSPGEPDLVKHWPLTTCRLRLTELAVPLGFTFYALANVTNSPPSAVDIYYAALSSLSPPFQLHPTSV